MAQSPLVPHFPTTKSRFGLSPLAGAVSGVVCVLTAAEPGDEDGADDAADEADDADADDDSAAGFAATPHPPSTTAAVIRSPMNGAEFLRAECHSRLFDSMFPSLRSEPSPAPLD